MKLIENIGQGGFGIVDKVMDGAGNIFAKKTFVRQKYRSL